MHSALCISDEKRTEPYAYSTLHTDAVVVDSSNLSMLPDSAHSLVGSQLSQAESKYTTLPLAAVRPASAATEDEVLHASFEEAISDRLAALHERHPRLSDPTITIQGRRETKPLAFSHPVQRRSLRWIKYSSLALMCGLLGFDLMGLLVLFAR